MYGNYCTKLLEMGVTRLQFWRREGVGFAVRFVAWRFGGDGAACYIVPRRRFREGPWSVDIMLLPRGRRVHHPRRDRGRIGNDTPTGVVLGAEGVLQTLAHSTELFQVFLERREGDRRAT